MTKEKILEKLNLMEILKKEDLKFMENLKGVFHENGYKIITNGKFLFMKKENYNEELESKRLNFNGNLEEIFPNYKSVMPKNEDLTENILFMTPKKWKSIKERYNLLNKFYKIKDYGIIVNEINGVNIAINLENLLQFSILFENCNVFIKIYKENPQNKTLVFEFEGFENELYFISIPYANATMENDIFTRNLSFFISKLDKIKPSTIAEMKDKIKFNIKLNALEKKFLEYLNYPEIWQCEKDSKNYEKLEKLKEEFEILLKNKCLSTW